MALENAKKTTLDPPKENAKKAQRKRKESAKKALSHHGRAGGDFFLWGGGPAGSAWLCRILKKTCTAEQKGIKLKTPREEKQNSKT